MQIKKRFITSITTTLIALSTTGMAQIMSLPTESEREALQPGFHPGNRAGIHLGADILYWHAAEDQLDYAWIVDAPNPVTPDIYNVSKKNVNFNSHFGARAAVGYLSEWSGMDFYLRYTGYSAKVDRGNRSDQNNIALLQIFSRSQLLPTAGAILASGAKTKWKLSYHAIDGEVGRSSLFGDNLYVRPFFGVRGLITDQRVKTSYTGLLDYSVAPEENRGSRTFKGKTSLFSVGPRIGIEGIYQLTSHISLTGKGAGSLLYGDAKIRSVIAGEDPSIAPPQLRMVLKEGESNKVRPSAEVYMGINCSGELTNGRHYLIGIGYEANYCWDQMGIYTLYHQKPNGDLSLQGWVGRLSVQF